MVFGVRLGIVVEAVGVEIASSMRETVFSRSRERTKLRASSSPVRAQGRRPEHGVTSMTHEQEVEIQTRGPDGGNPKPMRQGLRVTEGPKEAVGA